MTENAGLTAKKCVGVPFMKGDDPRRNLEGRPEGSVSPITRVKQIFQENPEEFEEFIRGYLKDPNNRKHIVEMIDGSPKGSGTTNNLAVQINQYTGTEEQNQLILEQSVIEVNEALQSGKLKYEDGRIK